MFLVFFVVVFCTDAAPLGKSRDRFRVGAIRCRSVYIIFGPRGICTDAKLLPPSNAEYFQNQVSLPRNHVRWRRNSKVQLLSGALYIKRTTTWYFTRTRDSPVAKTFMYLFEWRAQSRECGAADVVRCNLHSKQQKNIKYRRCLHKECETTNFTYCQIVRLLIFWRFVVFKLLLKVYYISLFIRH